MASLPSSYDIERNPGYAFISHGISGYAGSLPMFSVNHRYLKKQTLEKYFLDGPKT
jgi:hypothetical protein